VMLTATKPITVPIIPVIAPRAGKIIASTTMLALRACALLTNVLVLHRLGNCFRIAVVVLVRFYERPNKLRGNQNGKCGEHLSSGSPASSWESRLSSRMARLTKTVAECQGLHLRTRSRDKT
jgi:hypothetical protein